MGIQEKAMTFWSEWGFRIVIILSLLLQALLAWIAPLRMRKEKKRVTLLIWLVYLLADWAPAFTIGLLSSGFGDSNSKKNHIIAFWCPFLLLHLGGPDSISALALEDNELWPRQLVALLYQLIPTCYILVRSIQNNNLLAPTILMFVAGISKYIERTRALRLASFKTIEESLIQEADLDLDNKNYFQHLMAQLKATDQIEVVRSGYLFFKYFFRGLVLKLVVPDMRKKSREFFRRRTVEEVLSIMEVELGFMYEMLYTKVMAVHSKIGFALRFICVSSIAISLLLFSLEGKHGFAKIDVVITYVLLVAAISQEAIAIPMLVFSNWTFISITRGVLSSFLSSGFAMMFKQQRSWSESASQYNLISSCLAKTQHPKWLYKMADALSLGNFLDEMQNKSHRRVSRELILFILHEIAKKAEDAVKGLEVAGSSVRFSTGFWAVEGEGYAELLGWSVEVFIVDGILMWHIATEICYQAATTNNNKKKDGDKHQHFSKILSDYMLYIIVMQSDFLSSVMDIEKRSYTDTYTEGEEFFSTRRLLLKSKKNLRSQACDMLLRSEPRPISESLLFDGCRLARQLMELSDEHRWIIISRVWIEKMCNVASDTNGDTHAKLLNKGGELLTLVWLHMSHLGIARGGPWDEK